MTTFIVIIVLIACVLVASFTNYYKNPAYGHSIAIRMFACFGIIYCMMFLMEH